MVIGGGTVADYNNEYIFATVAGSIGISQDDTTFDGDIFMWTNGAIGSVSQVMNIVSGFTLKAKTDTWEDMMGAAVNSEATLQHVKTFITVKVQSIFDPGNGPTQTFREKFMQEELVRINYAYTDAKERGVID